MNDGEMPVENKWKLNFIAQSIESIASEAMQIFVELVTKRE